MRKKDIKIGEWYYIEYLANSKSKRRFVGPAKCKAYNENSLEFSFYSPLDDSEDGLVHMIFLSSHVKSPCQPLPSYAELYGIVCPNKV